MIALNIRLREACLAVTPDWRTGDGARNAGMSAQQWASYRRTTGYPPTVATQLRITDALRLPAGALAWPAADVVAFPTSSADGIERTTIPT